jgi:hypothetical protein
MRYLAIAASSLLILLSFTPDNPSAEVNPVNRAIDRGVVALKKALKGVQREENLTASSARGHARFASGELNLGVTALATLTLLECGVPADDPVILGRLPSLREASIKATQTYTLAILILVFDRVGDVDDVPLIHSLALRLLAGQYFADGWGYYCPAPPPDEAKKLTKLLKERPAAPRDNKDSKDARQAPLPGDVQEQLKQLIRMRQDVAPNKGNFQGRGDNSNTQFAVLGLWTARRYGIPIGPALNAVESRFRKSQGNDGGWGYVPSARGEANKDTGTTPSMTCAGLMVLGMCYSHAAERALQADPKAQLPDLARDPAVRAGFAYLAGGIGQPLGARGRIMPRTNGFTQTGYYYLWSLERVGVGYNLRLIGNKDWYAWGAAMLVASQEGDGFWQHEYGYVVDTCFALLFLKRVNLFKDATEQLSKFEGLGSVGSPGEKK